MTKTPFTPYTKHEITQSDIDAVTEALQLLHVTRGEKTEEFESKLAAYCGSKYAVTFNSGSSALQAAYHTLKLSPQDRLITTPNTFAATLTTAMPFGVDAQLVDIDRSLGLMEHNKLVLAINQRHSRGRSIIVPVHFAGIAHDMKKLNRAIANPETVIVEDAAHALGSYYPSGEKVGSCAYSDMTIFSFHPAKQLTTGEGGAVMTNDETYYKFLKKVRNNGLFQESDPVNPWEYDIEFAASNTHMSDIQASLGISQLERLDDYCKKRRELVSLYRKLLDNIPGIKLFSSEYDNNTCFHLMTVQINFKMFKTTRTKVMRALHSRAIGTQVHYIPLYHHTAVKEYMSQEKLNTFESMDAYYQEALSLPLFPTLSEDNVRRTVRLLQKILNYR